MNFDDKVLGLWLLNTLRKSWEIFWVSITNSTPNVIISFQIAKSGALKKYMRRKACGSLSQPEVFVIENKGRSQKRKGRVVEVKIGVSLS